MVAPATVREINEISSRKVASNEDGYCYVVYLSDEFGPKHWTTYNDFIDANNEMVRLAAVSHHVWIQKEEVKK